MSNVICDTSGIVARIDQLGDYATKHVTDVMATYAELIAWEMEKNAPHDTGALEGSIQVVKARDGINRRNSFTIQVNPESANQSGRSVSSYASIMDEFLTPHGSGGYNAREGTLTKGSQAGGRFLERSVNKYERDMIQHVRAMIKRVL